MEGQAMRIVVDEAADAAMIYLDDESTEEVEMRTAMCDAHLKGAAVILRLGPADRLLGFEILGASKILPPSVLRRGLP